MTSRDFLESIAGLLLPLAKIMLCLMFAGYDRIVRPRGGSHREAPKARPRIQAFGRG